MKQYSINLIAGIICILLCVMLFNKIVNPYDIFDSPAIAGVNLYKSEVERHTRLSKIYQVERIRPEVVLLASSRGLVVSDQLISNNSGLVSMNLSLPSASTYELYRLMQHAQAVHPLKKVILALDEEITNTVQKNYSEDRMMVDANGLVNTGKWLQKWRDVFYSLLSGDGLSSSIRTIRKQKMDPDRLNLDNYYSERIFNAGGHRQLFRNMEASILHGHSRESDDCINDVTDASGSSNERVIYFQKIVELAYRNNIELVIYISPVHARYYEAKCLVGEWKNIENMKRNVVRIVETVAKQEGNKPGTVWDFSGYNTITTEPVPAAGDRVSLMKWYLEGSHYSYKTAEIIFNTMFNRGHDPADFGIKLDTGNIEDHLNAIRAQRNAYIAAHGDVIKELKSIQYNAHVSQ
ncbi:MAG: hypothetical protein WBN96_03640 [Gammaproteobacteria bacterium]